MDWMDLYFIYINKLIDWMALYFKAVILFNFTIYSTLFISYFIFSMFIITGY